MWTPITSDNVVQRLRAAHERAILDFKQKYDLTLRTTKFELAKDVAAFSNHLGGSIVVGAVEGAGDRKGQLAALPGLSTNPSTGDVIKAIGDACRLCLPVPIADGVEIELGAEAQHALVGRGAAAVRIVVVNVPPMLTTPVGVAVCRDDGSRIDDAYRFPIRTVEGTRFLRPEELANHMNSHERRMLLQLSGLATPFPILLWCNPQGGDKRLSRPCQILEVNADLMVAILRYAIDGEEYTTEVPLIFVRVLWKSSAGMNLAIDGHAFEISLRGTSHHGFVPPGGILVG